MFQININGQNPDRYSQRALDEGFNNRKRQFDEEYGKKRRIFKIKKKTKDKHGKQHKYKPWTLLYLGLAIWAFMFFGKNGVKWVIAMYCFHKLLADTGLLEMIVDEVKGLVKKGSTNTRALLITDGPDTEEGCGLTLKKALVDTRIPWPEVVYNDDDDYDENV